MTELALRGRRVCLRPTIESDLADYERWLNPNLEAWKFDGPWFVNDGSPSMLERRRQWLSGDRRPPYRFLEIETGEHVHLGWVNLYHDQTDPHVPEVGIDIVEDGYWNIGLGTEALALWVDYLFRDRGLSRIGLATWSGNPRMIRVAEKLGFQREACIRNGCEVGGVFYDRVRLGLLRTEWQAARATWPLAHPGT